MKGFQFMLTVAMGKRLIARGLLADGQFRTALQEKKVVIVAGTTNAYVAEEVLSFLGEKYPYDLRLFRRGITVAPGAKVTPGAVEGDVLIDHGKVVFGKDIFELAPGLQTGDVILKGANAVNLPLGEAGVLIGHSEGGTMIPILSAASGRRVQVIIPVGVEKRVDASIARLSAVCGAEECEGRRVLPLPGRVFTEVEAIAALTGAQATLVAAGGAMGAEGGAYFVAEGTQEQIAAVKELVRSVKDEPPFRM